eukprot:3527968-Amphidinium_carterae.1
MAIRVYAACIAHDTLLHHLVNECMGAVRKMQKDLSFVQQLSKNEGFRMPEMQSWLAFQQRLSSYSKFIFVIPLVRKLQGLASPNLAIIRELLVSMY